MILIKKAKKEHIKDFMRLQEEFFKIYKRLSSYKIKHYKKQSKKEFKSRFGKDKFFYFAKVDGLIVGHIFGYIQKSNYGGWGCIDDIFVSKNYQGKGISTMLKNKILINFKNKKLKYCRIDINPKNLKAIKIYKQWGFKIDKFRMSLKI